MSATNISVNPDVRIIPGRVTTLISYPDRLAFICSECGHIKHVQYLCLQDVNILQRQHDAQDYCVCGQQMSNRHLLEEVYVGMGTCQTVEEARLFVLSLKSASA